jgi:hypothetical protein
MKGRTMSEEACMACGMPLSYDRLITGFYQISSNEHDRWCSFCADPKNRNRAQNPKKVDNAWVLDMLLEIYRSKSRFWKTLAGIAEKLAPILPANIYTMAKLINDLPSRSADSNYDALVLYSGGKDSSYMLLNLAQRNIRVCAWMLDQGYQSPIAIDNATQLCKNLGVPLVIEKPDKGSMDALFRLGFGIQKDESPELVRAVMTYGSACWPCFAMIAAASTVFCQKNKVPFCFIGTQEGQNRMDLNGQAALAGRGLPRVDDLTEKFMNPFRNYVKAKQPEAARLLTIGPCDTILIPFYEFIKRPSPEEQLRVLENIGWKMPKNTGFCSTNCMINELGRKVMRTRFGFDLYQIIDAHERRIGNEKSQLGLENHRHELETAAVLRGAKMIGLTEEERREYKVEVKLNA